MGALVAGTHLNVKTAGGVVTRRPGHPVPEAALWSNLVSYKSSGHVLDIPVGPKGLLRIDQLDGHLQPRIRSFGTEQLLIDSGILAGSKTQIEEPKAAAPKPAARTARKKKGRRKTAKV